MGNSISVRLGPGNHNDKGRQLEPLEVFDYGTRERLFRWANENKIKYVNEAFRLKGGWEGWLRWLQVELALWLQTQSEEGTLVHREQHVYKDHKQAVDVLVVEGRFRNIIELKCESVYQDCRIPAQDDVLAQSNDLPEAKWVSRSRRDQHTEIPSFAKQLEGDWGKRESVAKHYRPCQYTELGISLTKEAHDRVLEGSKKRQSW
jgi:hypothetical protein